MGVVAVIGLVVLALAFAYGLFQMRGRKRAANDPATVKAVHDVYGEKGPPHGEPSKDR